PVLVARASGRDGGGAGRHHPRWGPVGTPTRTRSGDPMTRRFVAVVAPPRPVPDAPAALRSAMLEDVCDLVAGLPMVEPALLVGSGDGDLAELVAPGTPVLELASLTAASPGVAGGMPPALPTSPGVAPEAGSASPAVPSSGVASGVHAAATSSGVVLEAVRVVGELGADQVVLISGDAPDLPALLVGKIFRGLATADAAVIPADGGGLVALGVKVPVTS